MKNPFFQAICLITLGCSLGSAGCVAQQRTASGPEQQVSRPPGSEDGNTKKYEVFQDGVFVAMDIDNADEIHAAIRTCILKSGTGIKYPPEARARKIGGTVHVEVIVNALGLLESTAVIHGIGYGCDQEAEQFVRKIFLNCAVQARLDDVPVRYRFVNPVSFNLE